MTIVYKAVDGKEFDTETKCREHEDALKAAELISCVHLWDEDKDHIEVTADILNEFDPVMFFRCDTEEAYKVILDILVNDGYAKGLTNKGDGTTWMWNEGEVKWQPIKDEIDMLQEKISDLMALEDIER